MWEDRSAMARRHDAAIVKSAIIGETDAARIVRLRAR
jgi:hypothetical protein